MKEPIHNKQLNRVLLKPRFNMELYDDKEIILDKFKKEFATTDYNFLGKIIDDHIIIDVPKSEEHFWSPQLHLELEDHDKKKTILKGLFGPKPQIWTFFMFLHFAVALGFIIFLMLTYTQWNLKQDYVFPLIMSGIMIVIWFVLYSLGQLGKRRGYQQMLELDEFMKFILSK